MQIEKLRKFCHQRVCKEQYFNFADAGNLSSRRIASGIVEMIGYPIGKKSIKEQTAGGKFEVIVRDFIRSTFNQLQHLRPGKWKYSTTQTAISGFDQYIHLAQLVKIVIRNKTLSSAIGGDYIVKPDIVVAKLPASDNEINRLNQLISENGLYANLTPLRESNQQEIHPTLHASISCKWTIRSDRAQNTRTEALNLIRNRKGRLPHIVAVTAEPLPTRLATLALGTGDLDCVYHFALNELIETLKLLDNQDQMDILMTMVDGRRLRDISDLPFDLAI